MSRLPVNLYSAEQVRELDRRVIEDEGVDSYGLMCRAGEAAFHALRDEWPGARGVVVLAGKGNNGGDGYVIARLAAAAGMRATLVRVGDHAGLKGSAARAARDCEVAGVAVEDFGTGLPPADIYVDALLGTGLDRPLRGDIRDAVRAVNDTGAPVFAVDVPTGLNADTGAVMGSCVDASLTATFIGCKAGLLTGEGPAQCGRLVFDSLNAPERVYRDLAPMARRLTGDDLREAMPPRRRTAHKGRFGHVLVVGGDQGMAGAARMAGEAAARSGAGLISVATLPDHVAAVVGGRPELMTHGVHRGSDLTGLLERATVVALGPGLGRSPWSKSLWLAVMASEKLLVLDADGLNWLARMPRRRARWVLTPHPGEAARLLGVEPADVQRDRFAAVAELAERFAATVVLKGAGTLVAAPGETPALCDLGNPGMATGGMGDVLTGVIAGLAAQGLAPFRAAGIGVLAHAMAADAAAAAGERGLIATDLFETLRTVLNP